jgi:hypothetical protein
MALYVVLWLKSPEKSEVIRKEGIIKALSIVSPMLANKMERVEPNGETATQV